MHEGHEILKLKIELGGSVDPDLENALREYVPEIIEAALEKNDPGNKTIIIDKIHLDLGRIKRHNLRDELLVRITYLLNAELEKLFAIKDFDAKLEQKINLTNAELFLFYLERGYGQKGDEDLSILFELLSETDFRYLNATIEEAKRSENALIRLFYQVKFELLISYWAKSYPMVYKEIEKVNEQLLQDYKSMFLAGQDASGLQGILKKKTFNFMLGELPSEKAGTAYLEFLKGHIDEFVSYEHELGQSTFLYFDNVLKEHSTENIEATIQKIEGIVVQFVVSGTIESGYNTQSIKEKVKQLNPDELRQLVRRLFLDLESSSFPLQIQRLFDIFSLDQLDFLLEVFQSTQIPLFKSSIAELQYLKKLTYSLFGENIYQFGHEFMSSFLLGPVDSTKKAKSLNLYINTIAIKKGSDEKQIAKEILRNIDASIKEQMNSLVQYFDNLLLDFSEETIKPVAHELEDRVVRYVVSGSVEWGDSALSIQESLKHFNSDELRSLAYQFSFNPESPYFPAQIQRFHETFSFEQLDLFLYEFLHSQPHYFQLAVTEFLLLKKLTSSVFSENIYQFGHEFMSSFLAGSIDSTSRAKSLDQYTNIIAAKKGYDQRQVAEKMLQQIDPSESNQSNYLARQFKKLYSSDPGSQFDGNLSPNDLMSIYLHFLHSGIWKHPGKTPQEALTQLLETSHSQLKQQLLKILDLQIPWLRLIYQNPIEILEKVLALVFEDDPDLKLLKEQLKTVAAADNVKLILYKIIEAFWGSKRQIEENSLGSFQLIFENKIALFLDQIENSNIEPKEIRFNTDIDQLIIHFLIEKDASISDKKIFASFLKNALHQPEVLFQYASDTDIPYDKWLAIIATTEKPTLLRLFYAIQPYTTKSEWIVSLLSIFKEKPHISILDKQTLFLTTIYMIRHQEDRLKELVLSKWLEFQKHTPKEAKKYWQDQSFQNLINPLTKLSFDTLDMAMKFSKKELIVLKKELLKLADFLNQQGVKVIYQQIQNLLIDNLPFVHSTSGLKYQIASSLRRLYPRYEKVIANTLTVEYHTEQRSESFLTFLFEIIESTLIEVTPHFENFEEFEGYLIKLIRGRGPILQVFGKTDINKLRQFLHRLQPATISELRMVVESKFDQSDFTHIYELLRLGNLKLEYELEVTTIAYGMARQLFSVDSYTHTMSRLSPKLTIPAEIKPKEISFQKEFYVEAFIHFLIHKKHIYPPVELDGLPLALSKIFIYSIDELKHQLSNQPNLKQLLSQIFDILPKGQWISFSSRIVPFNSKVPDSELNINLTKANIDLKEYCISYLVLVLSNARTLEHEEVVQLIIRTNKKSPKLPESSLKKIQPSKIEGFSEDQLSTLPKEFLTFGINIKHASYFTVFDLISEVIQSGKFPFWSVIYTPLEFKGLINEVVRLTPKRLRILLNETLTSVQNVRHLISILGRETFLDVIKLVDPKKVSGSAALINEIIHAHSGFGDEKALKTIFTIKYFWIKYKYGESTKEITVKRILQDAPIYFGLAKADYIEQLNDKPTKTIQIYLKSIAQENEEKIRHKDNQSDVDLLFHLITEGTIPWWARLVEPLAKHSIEENINGLIETLSKANPKSLFLAVEKSGEQSQIYEPIVKSISVREFEELVIRLSPEFGGFVVTFNLIFSKWNTKKKEYKWLVFLLRFLVNTKNFKLDEFVRTAVLFLSNFNKLDILSLKKQLLEIAKKRIQEGEMRYIPFIQLLGETDRKPLDKPGQTEQSAPPIVLDLDATVVYYMATGSLPLGAAPFFESYSKLVQHIEKRVSLDIHTFKTSIIKALSDKKILSRIIKYESDHFRHLIINILYPHDSELIAQYKTRVYKLFNAKWPSIKVPDIDQFFFKSIFGPGLEHPTGQTSVEMLISTFLEKVRLAFDLKFIFEVKELAKFGLNEKLFSPPAQSEEKHTNVSKDQLKKNLPDIPQFNEAHDTLLDQRVLIKNAGLVIAWPYLSKYFELLSMTENGEFKTKEEAIRAVLLLQYVATGSASAPEHELVLNKVLCGVKIFTPVPLEITLTQHEIDTSNMMLKGLLQNWPRLKDSSIEALREGFVVRNGYIYENEKTWELKVEKKTLDILMEELPWAFGMIKLPWMEKRLIVEWL
ncbi:MAG: contractile injection system tape measure protein [Cyclobacteriaceae bacterium]